ncbi:MAG: protein-glutamate O-methyltransferase CheR [Thermoanaerobaculia bacterium]
MSAMTPQEYELLNEFLSEQFGLTFPEHKKELLEGKLRPRIGSLGLKSFFDYYVYLQYDSNGELRKLAQLVTNNETYFFRETGQFESFFEHAVPEIRSQYAATSTLRILCAGCSSGEEPYTLSIFAKENQFRMWGTTVSIDAFDLDESRLGIARKAVYGASSFRGVDSEKLEKYFVPQTDGNRAVKPMYRSNVDFREGNILSADTYRFPGVYDAIFCRNVLIYFTESTLRKAVANFATALRPGGFLFLGHSESIIGLTEQFHPVRLGDTIAYRVEKD